jgi:plastocyanin
MRAALVVVLVAAIAVTTAATAAGGATRLKLRASPTALAFDRKHLVARAGTVTLVMANPSPLPHNVAVKGKGVRKTGKIVTKGGVSTISVTLKKGRYEFYCSVPGHEAAGMRGTLIVT